MDYSQTYYSNSLLESTGFLIFLFVYAIFSIIVLWKIFVKAGIPGWWSIIPFANWYKMFELFWAKGKGFMFILLFVPIANIIISIMLYFKMAKSFGKDGGFAVGSLLLNIIFMPILAFGDASYIGPDGIPLYNKE